MNNTLDKKYTDLQQDILDNGTNKSDRTGTGTISVFGRQIRHDMSEGFPLLTTKKMAWKSMVIELLWFLRGETNIRPLVLNGCNIWNGDAYKYYEKNVNKASKIYPKMTGYYHEEILSMEEFVEKIKNDPKFAEEWGDLGPIYGKQWRKWVSYIPYDCTDENCKVVVKITDQIADAIEKLKYQPYSRRIMVNAWNVNEIPDMKLPPCHYAFQFWTRDLTWEEFDRLVREKVDDATYEIHLQYREAVQKMKKAVQDQDFELAAELKKSRDGIRKELESILEDIPTKGISLMWNQRSVDTFLGLPFNIASYGLLLQIIAQHVNMLPLELIGSLGDTHLYNDHIEQAKEQISREGYDLPKVKIAPFEKLEDLKFEDFELIGYKSHPRIKAPLSN